MASYTPPHEEPPSASEAVAMLRLQLSPRSLRELETSDIVEVNSDNGLVEKGRSFEKTWDAVFR